jgi:hypothetical protein
MSHVFLVAEMVHQLRIVAWLIVGVRHTLRASFIAGTLR